MSKPRTVESPMPAWVLHTLFATFICLLVSFFVVAPKTDAEFKGLAIITALALLALVIHSVVQSKDGKHGSEDRVEFNTGFFKGSIGGPLAIIVAMIVALVFLLMQLYNAFIQPSLKSVQRISVESSDLEHRVIQLAAADLNEVFLNDRSLKQNEGRPTREAFNRQLVTCHDALENVVRLRNQLQPFENDGTVKDFLGPIRDRLTYSAATLRYLEGNYDEALREASIPITADMNTVDRMMVLRAKILTAQGNYEEAELILLDLNRKIPGDRTVLTTLGSLQLKRAFSMGAKIAPDGHPELVPHEIAKLLDSAIKYYNRAIISTSLFPHYSTSLYEHGPSIGLAVAKGCRRLPLTQLSHYQADFDHAYNMLDLMIETGEPNALRDFYLANRLRMTDIELDLFRKPFSDKDYETLSRLCAHAISDAGRDNARLYFMSALGTSAKLSAESGDLDGLSTCLRRMESLLGETKADSSLESRDDIGLCLEEICRASAAECSLKMLQVEPKTKGGIPLNDQDLEQILICEARFDAFVGRLRDSRRSLEYFMALGWAGQRRLILSSWMTGSIRTNFQETGKAWLEEAIEGATRHLQDSHRASNDALQAIERFNKFYEKYCRVPQISRR